MFNPSEAKKGFVDDPACPILLGKGFGPLCYQHLFDQWKEISDKSDFSSSQIEGVNLLLSRMWNCDQGKVCAGVLSGTVASTYQILLNKFKKGEESILWFEHQTYVPNNFSSSVDIAITNARDVGHKTMPWLHAILEAEWEFSDKRFPEIQATASARLFFNAQTLRRSWVPIFVLSKTHFRFGVAFQLFGSRWAYSEIYETQKKQSYTPNDPDDVINLCRFSLFMVRSAEFHQEYAGQEDSGFLVDQHGTLLYKQPPSIIADRVFLGLEDVSRKVMKFYADQASAVDAMRRQKLLEEALGIATKAGFVVGCGDGMSAVKYDFFPSAPTTKNHLIKLTKIVSALQRKGLLHGDLRLENIIFGPNDEVFLIDFDWAERIGTAQFPPRANILAFGRIARSSVAPGGYIPHQFDWLCLADILENIEGAVGAWAARAAVTQDESQVLAALDTLAAQDEAQALRKLQLFLPALRVPSVLNLSRVSARIESYFESSAKKQKPSEAARRGQPST